ncbi:MAG: PhnD/SsuA/transferrin family substrate-binding protein [Chloroflexi bacterium]|nr:PhnD/SsuA/transferrin family substrate-binding protein [Chloroflexota bacterium]
MRRSAGGGHGLNRLAAWVVAVIAVVVLASGCGPEAKSVSLTDGDALDLPAPPPPEIGVYSFGFDRRLEPSEDVRMYVPLLKILEERTGYRFRLHVTPASASVVDEIGNGSVQFGAVGTLSYLAAEKKYGAEALVAGRTPSEDASYRALIVTLPTSDIHGIADLRGRSLALGSPSSTQGHLIPRLMLRSAGLSLADLSSFQYHSSHAETANAVLSGRFDAGAIQDTLGWQLIQEGRLRLVAESEPYPSSVIAVAPFVSPAVVDAVRTALLDLDTTGRDAPRLYHWERSEMPLGFMLIDPSRLDRVREHAEELGILR